MSCELDGSPEKFAFNVLGKDKIPFVIVVTESEKTRKMRSRMFNSMLDRPILAVWLAVGECKFYKARY